ncbi:MAG: hypothetical protein D6744_15550, partial [Planctomycetota bacterium]
MAPSTSAFISLLFVFPFGTAIELVGDAIEHADERINAAILQSVGHVVEQVREYFSVYAADVFGSAT